MNRRDTIIIAVLINAGLLLVLFATAISSESESESEENLPSPTVITQMEEPTKKEPSSALPTDEVDQVLSQWNASAMADAALNSKLQSVSSPQPVTLGYETAAFVDPKNDKEEQEVLQPIVEEPKKSTSEFTEIVVKKGDALERIAKTYGTTVQEIMRLNKLSRSQLRVGQVLKVPQKLNGTASATKANSSKQEGAKNTAAQYYVVKSGDNPWLIAKKNHISLDELLQLNQLDEGKARKLQPGDKIRIK